MKTVCLYFQVHQPWRLKKYRFFNMGKDHNYLDDLLNRSIMQKVARQCYLPMNALLLKLIRENKGKFRCSFSITGIAIEQFRTYAPEVLGVDQLCVSEGGRFHPEFLFYKCRVEFYLFGEILLRSQRGQRV